ncbi:MAG: CcoQ/FixQ family Cbb3-type cytochrome c oxidase assembly chaperone [Chitinophagales bacterium]|nr:CcoQ/FixQ family Cbb3-type cytochrome c oxidase assembly chaperone [Chitinophagales bacterium]MCZ2392346.1 CcoQ/FixQ family Cbb3-type cytochrome c oxidase assembly chaperone [Chitinophagales bacterium]
MKFSNYLTTIDGVGIYPVISLVLFVVFFVLVTLWVFKLNTKELEHIEQLPLNDK